VCRNMKVLLIRIVLVLVFIAAGILTTFDARVS
jgi:hypothetical protein